MKKNVDGQYAYVRAIDIGNSGADKTGDAANIVGSIVIDGGARAATNDVNPTEIDSTNLPGLYRFTLLQAETNGDTIAVGGVSSTSNIVITSSEYHTEVDLSGVEAKVDTIDTATAAVQAVTDNLPNSGALTDLATAAALATVDTVADAILVDTGTTLPALIATRAAQATTITVRAAVTADENIELVQGDDYLDADGEAVTWTITDYDGPGLTSATALLSIQDRDDYEDDTTGYALQKAGSVSVDGTTVTVKVDLTAAETLALARSPYTDGEHKWSYVYLLTVITSGGTKATHVKGKANITKRIA